ncbi:MFS transporter [Tuwongella immobilis]|uniref:Major facilitator superfamily (MFS) profile domain-containing protein n=1 Tax=Tuwongella immobilis TaxID=692036 RepID=A0A6C2YHW1_9BACT|nr:MFS transporter [Tuwongella immobilis]VIP00851.1 Nucleoside:H symporter OS=Coraliomargarita akajimensis (strain DSM 45221 / IAM 15411 / JCM 23193 / KCTC 12865) GN=Caka_0543 PE=4 SV=1: Nuc_H_symport: Nuc_H_symport [Tuwongella immobilis]VTR97120.1 Nucleoside:H symporter OS=Coraliomargarita akajimensis (strain DSM 45221 / IAM 15411 / JCM 23193 / KCTC 12865) GN=Caka_0543 PE=4 SV=1: Nuc_H_symport: Nuc_H_symport [Tuwongella immobilis]
MDRSIRVRLSGMMFLHYLVMGAWVVPLAPYLMALPTDGGLLFTATQTSQIYSTLAIAGIVAPLFIGLLADRLFAAQRIMVVMNFIGCGLMATIAWWCASQQAELAELYHQKLQLAGINGDTLVSPAAGIASQLQRLHQDPELRARVDAIFRPLFGMLFAYAMINLTTTTLTNVVSLRNLERPREMFGKVRLVGTFGWVVSGLVVAMLLNPISNSPMLFACVLSIASGLYCLLLPHTPPAGKGTSIGEMLGLPALGMLRDRSFAVFLICACTLSMVQSFWVIYTNKFLTDIQAPKPTAVQTLAQWSEMLCMALMPLAFIRLGVKWMMVLGLLGWLLRNGLFATGSMPLSVVIGLPLHGLSYCFFYITAQLYIDRMAPLHLRASAQAIFVFVSSGVGTLVGNVIASSIVQANTVGSVVNWTNVWLVPFLASAVILTVFLAFFRGEVPVSDSGHPHPPQPSDGPNSATKSSPGIEVTLSRVARR